MKKALVLVSLAGAASAALANPVVETAPMFKKAIRPISATNVLTGETIRPGTGFGEGRAIVQPYDTCHYAADDRPNAAWVNGANYAAGTGSAYIARTFTTTGAAGAPTLTFNYTLDNGTPTNPNDDLLINAATDCVFDDFAFDESIADVNGTDTVPWTSMRTKFTVRNWSKDDNGTPTNPNDDFFIARQNTLVTLFWAIDDNGTPTNPNDDFAAFVNGVNLTFNFGANTSFFYTIAPVDLTALAIEIPGEGIIMQDWVNFSPSHIDGDNGTGISFTGGDDHADGVATGLDGIAIPAYDTLPIRDHAAVDSNGEIGGPAWFFSPTANPALIDVGADGNASDTTYTDILLSGFGVWWGFAAATGPGGAGAYDLAGDLSYELTVDADATNPCPADLTGSSDPNDPSYGVPDGDADADDFFFYLDLFVANNGDLTGSSDPNDPSYGVPDGDSDADDFFFYLDLFVGPCNP